MTVYGSNLTPQWGIYLDGAAVVTADSCIAFNMRVERAISNYPIERGGFESYDKVAIPYLVKIQLATGGDSTARSDFLAAVADATDMLVGGKPAKFDVVTPEIVYLSASISHYDYDRKAEHGLGLVIVDIWIQEVREQNTGTTSSVDSSGASESNGGNVDGQTGTDSSSSSSSDPFSGATGGSTSGLVTGDTGSTTSTTTFDSNFNAAFTNQDLSNNSLSFSFSSAGVQ